MDVQHSRAAVAAADDGRVHTCPHCTRGFKRELAYDRHVALCFLMSRSARKRKHDDNMSAVLPTMADMFQIVVEMKAKQAQLERKVEELSKWVETKKRKLDVLDWLKTHRPQLLLTFPAWVATLEARVQRKHLELIFAHDYINGVRMIVFELLPGMAVAAAAAAAADGAGAAAAAAAASDQRPITAFNVNDNILYIYSATEQWEIMSDALFSTLTNAIYRGILDQLILWQRENRWRMHQDDFTPVYAANIKKVTGGSLSYAYMNGRIRRDLYNLLKVNVHTITEVELSF